MVKIQHNAQSSLCIDEILLTGQGTILLIVSLIKHLSSYPCCYLNYAIDSRVYLVHMITALAFAHRSNGYTYIHIC